MRRPKELLSTDGEGRAVSPVIGVILMVAITVILAAVIATFVIGLGDSTNSAQPNLSLDYNYADNSSTDSTSSNTDYDLVTISVDSAGSTDVDPSDIKISDSSPVNATVLNGPSNENFGETISAGDEVTLAITTDDPGGEEIELIYETDDSSDTLDSSTIPDN